METRLRVIISGAQTGADRAGLEWAKDNGYETAGWMPADFRASDGNHPEFADLYNIRATRSGAYPSRTKKNVVESNGTVLFGIESPGFILTARLCEQVERPCFVVPYHKAHPTLPRIEPPEENDYRIWSLDEYIEQFAFWLKRNGIEILNVAGNREHNNPGIGNFVKMFLSKAIQPNVLQKEDLT